MEECNRTVESYLYNCRNNYLTIVGKKTCQSSEKIANLIIAVAALGIGPIRNGKYGLIEIKLGGDKLIEEGAKSLRSMQDKIDTDKMNVPSFLMVLTGIGDYAYRRQDGVFVIPIGCLKV